MHYPGDAMPDWILRFDPIPFLLVGSVLMLVGVLLWQLVRSALRDRRLQRDDPPSRRELEEIEALRRAGGFHLGGRGSAAARHFEGRRLQRGGANREGSRGTYEPYLTESWRDDRSGG